MPSDWDHLLSSEFAKDYFLELSAFVADERKNFEVYPPEHLVFNAFETTPLSRTKVLLLGQDPYHGANQAHGLSFSVQRGTSIPPSLCNIFKELRDDLGIPTPSHGSLQHWAEQGVLLLNSTLTVRAGEAGSHRGHGWEQFTDAVIDCVASKETPVVFVLWGASARAKRHRITAMNHTIIESAHPSPLSARNGFFGSAPFSRINAALASGGLPEIDWALPPED